MKTLATGTFRSVKKASVQEKFMRNKVLRRLLKDVAIDLTKSDRPKHPDTEVSPEENGYDIEVLRDDSFPSIKHRKVVVAAGMTMI